MPTKPKKNQPETPNDVQGKDLFQTPKYAVDLLIPFIPKNINRIWECAAGDLKISNVLLELGYHIISSDIRNNSEDIMYHNFLLDKPIDIGETTAIITNPPYSLKRKFYEKCREYEVPFALLIPADYSGWIIEAICNDNAEKIIPSRRINYITPNLIENIWRGETKEYIEKNTGNKFKNYSDIPEFLVKRYENIIKKYNSVEEIPPGMIVKYSKSQFHSLWITHGFNLGKSEIFLDLTKEMMYNI